MWKFLIIAAFSVLWAFNASQDFDGERLGKSSKTGCNRTLSKNNSEFHLNVHNLTDDTCFWNLTVTEHGKTVHLFFLQVFIHETDNVTLYKSWTDAVNRTNPLMKNPIRSLNGTLTLITNEKVVVVRFDGGKDPSFSRTFEGYYSVDVCMLPVPPEVEIVYAPTYLDNVSEEKECDYHFNEITHKRATQVFTFEEFNMPSSSVEIDGGTISGEYKNNPPTDFFMEVNKKLLTITVKQALNSSDNFKLKIHEVDSSCSGKFEISELIKTFPSPRYELNNGTIINECRWLIQNKITSRILGIQFNKIDFHSVFDIVAVNDGSSEISPPLLQVTTSNRNFTQNQVIRASGPSLWVAFKPLSYESIFDFNITVHGQGGYFRDSGKIEMKTTTGDDTFFLLEVKSGEVVMLTFDASSIKPPATVSIYDGFATSNLLTSLHGQIHFPIFSRSSRMMVTGTKFSDLSNHFSAHFRGVVPGCNHMSSVSSENYILSENCNSTCVWVIPPQDTPNSALVVYLQYISLKVGDNLKIHKLDATLSQLAEIGANETYLPHFAVPADVGVLINVTQSECKERTDKVILIGHSSYIPACGRDIIPKPSESFQISSPLYPDTYPVFSNCHWNVTAPKGSIVHMAFQNLNLAKNHCVRISEGSAKPNTFEGNTLPNDLFFTGDVVVDFDSSGCNKSEVSKTLNSDSGFMLNVTVTDCGAILEGKKSGEFNTSISGNRDVCVWKVSVPPKNDKSVNIISYVSVKKDKSENYVLHVYDGSTVRDSDIENNTESEIWSRTNTLIFVYRRLNVSQPSSVFVIKYNTISCNTSCDNNICMHPDWRCNGKNDCGDFSDERNCASVPIPPEVKITGYSGTAFWLCAFAMLLIGVILGLTVPVCYKKYKDSSYRRFHELDST